MSYKEGLLVSFEGQDGSGKSTLLKLVCDTLTDKGHAVEVVPEFSERIIGSYLVEQLLSNKFLRMNEKRKQSLSS